MSEFGRDAENFSDREINDIARMPYGILPTAAANAGDIRGRRVTVGLPGLGWRCELRADTPIAQGSRTYVPVLPEQEWYRAESEQTEVFAPLIPAERVWVEIPTENPSSIESADFVSQLVSLDAPPQRIPIPARAALPVTGRRVIRLGRTPDSDLRNLRAVTEPHTTTDGDICIRVCMELDWYRWAWSGKPPKTRSIPIHLLWLE